MRGTDKLIMIGGSAGSLPVLMQLLKLLKHEVSIPIIIIIHRQRNIYSDLPRLIAKAQPHKTVIEPDDKTVLQANTIYIAPQNYHLLIGSDQSINLDYSETVNYSRPSVDVSFESAAHVFKNGLTAILLSGANKDGSNGLLSVVQQNGVAIVQDPATAEYPFMPAAAISVNKQLHIFSLNEMVAHIHALRAAI